MGNSGWATTPVFAWEAVLYGVALAGFVLYRLVMLVRDVRSGAFTRRQRDRWNRFLAFCVAYEARTRSRDRPGRDGS